MRAIIHQSRGDGHRAGAAAPARWWLAGACLLLAAAAGAAGPGEDTTRVHAAAGSFDEVLDALRNAVIERGFIVQTELHASEMLDRTAPDLGIEGRVFGRAEGIEFCSAFITQRMVRVHPANLVFCPFRVMVYTLDGDPGTVHIAYPRYVLAGDDGSLGREVAELLEGIATEALDQ